jgi:acyl-[acyl-carrier-protein] desaturase
MVIRDWVTVHRALDLIALERARMRLLCSGFAPGPRGLSPIDGLVYLTLQELATRISHRNTAGMLDPSGAAVLRQVAADENLPYVFYRDLVSAALAAAPSLVVQAIDRQVTSFVMPGEGIDGFSDHARRIAAAGVYDFRVHYEQVVAPVVLKHWHIDAVELIDADGERARTHLLSRLERLRRISEHIAASRTC